MITIIFKNKSELKINDDLDLQKLLDEKLNGKCHIVELHDKDGLHSFFDIREAIIFTNTQNKS